MSARKKLLNLIIGLLVCLLALLLVRYDARGSLSLTQDGFENVTPTIGRIHTFTTNTEVLISPDSLIKKIILLSTNP